MPKKIDLPTVELLSLEAPTSEPAITSTELSITNPAAAAASPE